MTAAIKSGSGKTMVTAGLIRALVKKGLKVHAKKCGPDYIDPMYLRIASQGKTGNLDPFFCSRDMLRYLIASEGWESDITVIEGVMGYYDGLGGVSEKGSSYDAATATKTPVVMIVDSKGLSVTLSAVIKGVLEYRRDNLIQGIILNRISSSFYERIAPCIETECGIRVLGYVPELKDAAIGSRHLGLTMPFENDGIAEKIDRIADIISETVDIEAFITLAGTAEPIDPGIPAELAAVLSGDEARIIKKTAPVIAVAGDEAFAFCYDDNLKLLEELGGCIKFFSPIHDKEIPKDASGIIFYGGYPEEYAGELSANKTMLASVRKAHSDGIPIIAECGGFMYLSNELEDKEGNVFDMCGVIPGKTFYAGRAIRFGYFEAKALKSGLYGREGTVFRGHEFHHWDCSANGEDFEAAKPMSDKRYTCIFHDDTIAAGFPHVYAYSSPEMYLNFLYKCALRCSGTTDAEAPEKGKKC